MMKNFLPKIQACLLLLGLLACQQQQKQGQEEVVTLEQDGGYKVIAIKDGDTIEILKDGKPLRIRLYGVDAPEKNQDFGTRAQQFTSDLCFGKFVEMEEKNRDRYGRTVGLITLPDGRSLNEELVREGYAWHYKAYSNDPKLAELEAEARANGRGLWAGPNPTAPWDFRKNQRTGVGNVSTENIPAKPSDAGRTVYICDSPGATTYHGTPTCSSLKRCKSDTKSVTRGTAVVNLRRTAHSTCN